MNHNSRKTFHLKMLSLTGRKSVVSEPEEDLPPFQDEKAVRPPSKNPKSSEKEIQSGIVNIQHEITRQEAAVKKRI